MQQQHTKHKVLNWGEYNKALIHRGSMTLWLSDNLVNTRTYALTNLLNWCLCRFMHSGMLL